MIDASNFGWVRLIVQDDSDDQELAAAGKRLRTAFPYLSRLLPAISVGVERGRSWEHVVEAFVSRLAYDQLQQLAQEVVDFIVIGSTHNEQFDLLVTTCLGLDPIVLNTTSVCGWDFCCYLHGLLSDWVR